MNQGKVRRESIAFTALRMLSIKGAYSAFALILLLGFSLMILPQPLQATSGSIFTTSTPTPEDDPAYSASQWLEGAITSHSILLEQYTCASDAQIISENPGQRYVLKSLLIIMMDSSPDPTIEVDFTDLTFEATEQTADTATVHLSGRISIDVGESVQLADMDDDLYLVYEEPRWRVCQLSDPRALLESAHNALISENYEEALQAYQQYLEAIGEADPPQTVLLGMGEAFLQLGVEAFERQDYAAALENYLSAQEFIPNDPRLHNNIGYTLQQTGNFQEAVLAYNQALELNPNYGRAWANLADTAVALENYPLASSAYLRALDLSVELDALSYSNYCIALAEQRIEPETAIMACEKSIELAPDTPIFLARTAHMLVAFDQPNEAILMARQALAIDPNMTLAYRVLGDAYVLLGNSTKAETAYRRALELDPNNIKAQAGLDSLTD
jgi:tetratricopeptide (TPR) repeat protein